MTKKKFTQKVKIIIKKCKRFMKFNHNIIQINK